MATTQGTPAYSSGNVFGADAEAIRQQIEAEQNANAMAAANMPAGRGMVYAAAKAGDQLGGGMASMAGYQDPRIRSASMLEDAAKEVNSGGYSLMTDPESYYKATYAALTKRGLFNEAGKVHDIMVQQATAASESRSKAMVAQAQLNTSEAELKNAGNTRYETSADGIVTTDRRTGEVTVNKDVTGKAGSAVGKIENDYNNGLYGEVGSPEALALKQKAIDKATNLRDPELEATLGLLKGIALDSDRSTLALENTQVVEAMKSANAVLENTRKSAYDADSIVDSADAIINTVSDGKTVTGSLFNVRNTVAKFVNLVSPQLSETVEKELKANPTDASALEYAHSVIVASTAKQLAGEGDKLSKTAIDLLRQGDAATATPEGLYVVSSIQKARALKNKRVHDMLAKYLVPREGESTQSDSYKERLLRADVERNNLLNTVKLRDFLPDNLEERAREAVELSRLPYAPVDKTKAAEGKSYRSLTTGQRIIWKNGTWNVIKKASK